MARADLGGGGQQGVGSPLFQSGPPLLFWNFNAHKILILSNDLFFYNVVVRNVFCQYSYTK